jgi:hypothetical protein
VVFSEKMRKMSYFERKNERKRGILGYFGVFFENGWICDFGDSMSSVTAPAEKGITAKMEGFQSFLDVFYAIFSE